VANPTAKCDKVGGKTGKISRARRIGDIAHGAARKMTKRVTGRRREASHGRRPTVPPTPAVADLPRPKTYDRKNYYWEKRLNGPERRGGAWPCRYGRTAKKRSGKNRGHPQAVKRGVKLAERLHRVLDDDLCSIKWNLDHITHKKLLVMACSTGDV